MRDNLRLSSNELGAIGPKSFKKISQTEICSNCYSVSQMHSYWQQFKYGLECRPVSHCNQLHHKILYFLHFDDTYYKHYHHKNSSADLFLCRGLFLLWDDGNSVNVDLSRLPFLTGTDDERAWCSAAADAVVMVTGFFNVWIWTDWTTSGVQLFSGIVTSDHVSPSPSSTCWTPRRHRMHGTSRVIR